MRLVFFGTPEFAVPSLDAVVKEHEVALVVAQPDKPAGRGMKMQAPPVAVRARELGLPLLQPARIRNEEFLGEVARAGADAGVVIAYGKILPAALLAIPKHGFFNVHGSILPRWRGAAPIQRAIQAGDRETGVTIMRIDEELDHGPMLEIAKTEIGPDERTPELAKRLAIIGAEAMVRVLRDVEHGVAVETPQDHASATFATKLDKSEGETRFDESARTIYDRFRAFNPWPGIFATIGGETIKLTEMKPVDASGKPRTVLAIDHDVVIACAEGALRIFEMQRAGKPRTPAGAIARGLGWRVGDVLP
jgi:methionyl-tRNA formyltransferase